MVHLEIALGKEQPHVAIVRRGKTQCFEHVLKYERVKEDKMTHGLRKKKIHKSIPEAPL